MKKLTIGLFTLAFGALASSAALGLEMSQVYEEQIEEDMRMRRELKDDWELKKGNSNLVEAFIHASGVFKKVLINEKCQTYVEKFMLPMNDNLIKQYNYWIQRYNHNSQAFRYAIAYEHKFKESKDRKLSMAFARCVASGFGMKISEELASEFALSEHAEETFESIDKYLLENHGVDMKAIMESYFRFYSNSMIVDNNDEFFADAFAVFMNFNVGNETIACALAYRYIMESRKDINNYIMIDKYMADVDYLKERFKQLFKGDKEVKTSESVSREEMIREIISLTGYDSGNRCEAYYNDKEFISGLQKYLSLLRLNNSDLYKYVSIYLYRRTVGMSEKEAAMQTVKV